jgi:hypothetical protein
MTKPMLLAAARACLCNLPGSASDGALVLVGHLGSQVRDRARFRSLTRSIRRGGQTGAAINPRDEFGS